MSDWEQQHFCEMRRWHEDIDKRVRNMQRQIDSPAFKQLLNAERLAAKQDTTKTQVNSYEVSGESVSGF